MTGRADCITGYVLSLYDWLRPHQAWMHTSTLTCAAVGTHRRSCYNGVLACAPRTRISRCARFGADSTAPQKGCMHQPSTSACIRLGNDAGRNHISVLVCPRPIYSGGASCPHQTHIHTYASRTLAPESLDSPAGHAVHGRETVLEIRIRE
jgi:hypothetical protein